MGSILGPASMSLEGIWLEGSLQTGKRVGFQSLSEKMRHRMVGAKGLQPFLEALLEEKTGVLHLISYPALFREPGVVAMRFVQC